MRGNTLLFCEILPAFSPPFLHVAIRGRCGAEDDESLVVKVQMAQKVGVCEARTLRKKKMLDNFVLNEGDSGMLFVDGRFVACSHVELVYACILRYAH